MVQNTQILTLGASESDKMCKIQENMCKMGFNLIKTIITNKMKQLVDYNCQYSYQELIEATQYSFKG